MSHPCAVPAPGCTKQVPAGILMCKPHWHLLPRNLQRQVTSAWRGFLAGAEGSRRTYDDAVAAAVAHVLAELRKGPA